MTNIFPPVLESQSPAMPYSGDATTNLQLQFMMPEINDVSAIKHVQVSIKYKETGRPAVNVNYAPDGATLFIPCDLPQYWTCDPEGKCILNIPYKCFKERKVEENTTYSIQIRFGVANIWGSSRDPFAGMKDDFSDFTVWRINQTSTLPSGFGEWSNITSVYCCGESLTTISYNLSDFVPEIYFYYEPKYNDPISSCFIHYSYQDFSGMVTKSLVQSGQVQQDGKYSVVAKLNIAPVVPINISLEATTVNNTLVGATISIPPITEVGGDIPLFPDAEGTFLPLNLLAEEQDDGVLGKKLRVRSSTPSWVPEAWHRISIYRANLYDFTTIRIAEDLELSSMLELSFKDYTPEMGEDYQYIAIMRVGFTETPYQLSKVYPWGFENSGYDRLMKLDSIYFVDKHHQLKIEANANISTFKRNTSDVFQTTIGSKYPFYSRPSKINYRTFQFSGVVTIKSDPTGAFLANDPDNGLYWKDETGDNLIILNRDLYNSLETSRSRVRVGLNALTNEEIIEYGLEEAGQIRGPSSIYDSYYAKEIYSNLESHLEDNVVYVERKFREKIMEWVSNGKPKLFRTETEGNMIVILSAVTFNPQAKTGRTVYQISGTATEIADYSMENLIEYDLIPRNIETKIVSSFPRQLKIGDVISAENYRALIFINDSLSSCFAKEVVEGKEVDDRYVVINETNLQETLDSITAQTFIRGNPQYPIYQGIYYKGTSELAFVNVQAGPGIVYSETIELADLSEAFDNSGLVFTPLDPSAWPNLVTLETNGKILINPTSAGNWVGLMPAKSYAAKASNGTESFVFTFRMENFYAPLAVEAISIGPEISDIKDTQQEVRIRLNVTGGVPFPSPIYEAPTPYRFTPMEMPYGLEIDSFGVIKGRIAQATDGGRIEVLITDAMGNMIIWNTSYNQIRNWPVVTQLPQFNIDYPEVGQHCGILLSEGISGSGDYDFQLDTSLVGNSLPSGLVLDESTGVISGTFDTSKNSSTTCYIKVRDNNLTSDTTVWHTSIQVSFGSILPTFKFEGPTDILLPSGETRKGIVIQGPSSLGPVATGLIPIPLGTVLNTIDLNGVIDPSAATSQHYVTGGLPFYSGTDPYYKFSGFALTPDYSVSSLGLLNGMAQSGKPERIAWARVRDMRGVELDMPIRIADIVTNMRYVTAPEGHLAVQLYIGEALAGSGDPFIREPGRPYELRIPVGEDYLSGGFLKPGAGGYKFEIVDPENRFNWLEVSPSSTTGVDFVSFRQKAGTERPTLSAQKTYVPVKISDDSGQSVMINIALGPIIPQLRWADGSASKSLSLNTTQIGVEASVNLPEIVGGKPPYTVSAASMADVQGLLPFRVYQNENAEYDVTKYRVAGTPTDPSVAPSAAMILSDSSGQKLPFVINGAAPALPLDYGVQNANLYLEVVLIKGVSQITTADNIQIFTGIDGSPPYNYSVSISGMPTGYINRADPSLPGAVGLQMNSSGILTGCPGESASVLILGTETARVIVNDTVTSCRYTDEAHQWRVPKVVDKIYPRYTSEYLVPSMNEGTGWSSEALFSGGIGASGHPNLKWTCNGVEIPEDGTIMIDGVDSGLRWNKEGAYLWSNGVNLILNNKQLVIRSVIFRATTRFLTTDYIEQVTVRFQNIVEVLNWETPEGRMQSTSYVIPLQRYVPGATNLYSINLNNVPGEFRVVGGIQPLTWHFSGIKPPPSGWTLSSSSPGVLQYTIPRPEYGPTFIPPVFTVEATDQSGTTISVNIEYQGAVDDIRFNPSVTWPSIPIMPKEEPVGTYEFEIDLNALFNNVVEGGSMHYGYELVTNDAAQAPVPPYSDAFSQSGISMEPVSVEGYDYPARTALLYVWDQEVDSERARQISRVVNIGQIIGTLSYPATPGNLISIPQGRSRRTSTFTVNKASYFKGGLGFSPSMADYPPYWREHGGNITVSYNSATNQITFNITYPEVTAAGDCPASTVVAALSANDPVFDNTISCDMVFGQVLP